MSAKYLLAFSLSLCTLPAFASRDLPDACGSDDVKFNVKADKATPYTGGSAPAVGMARIVFIQNLHSSIMMIGRPTIRIGVDGAWVGALHGKSYFSVELPAGEHHLCGAWQSILKAARKEDHAKSLNLESGKTYFVQYKIEVISGDPGSTTLTSLDVMDQDEGKFVVKTLPLATWTTNQPVTQASTH